MNEGKPLIVIPARYASTRFPGKPLAIIGVKPMIQWVYENALKTSFDVVVATDDKRISSVVESFGGKVILTREDHPSGTDRCFEAASKWAKEKGKEPSIVINVQGDEPFIQAEQILSLVETFEAPDTQIATLARKFNPKDGFETLHDPNKVKVIFNKNGRAIYFSRSVIPFVRGHKKDDWFKERSFFHHVGMYAYRFDALRQIINLPPSSLELNESLEQLRWLENEFIIKVKETWHASIGIDTPEDLEIVNQSFN